MVPLHLNLLTPAEDLWLFETTGSDLTYSLIFKPIRVRNVSKIVRAVDLKSHMHFFILNKAKQAFHVIWDSRTWKKNRLPLTQWDQLVTFIGSTNKLYILAKNSSGFRILTRPNATQYADFQLRIAPSDLQPLFFTIDSSYMYLYLIDPARSTVTANTVSRRTGKIQAQQVLVEDDKYFIIKHWVLGDSLLLLLRERVAAETNLYFMKINLKTKEHWLEQHGPLDLSEDTSYDLLADESSLLLLATTYNSFYYAFSFDAGQKWTIPQQTTLFSPVIFSEISSVNNHPTGKICVKKMSGCDLQHPLILNYAELSAIIRSSKVIYPDIFFKPLKNKK